MVNHRWQVIVIGAGAAGLYAAISAAKRGRQVLLLEKNERPGVKILMSGGTRCNLTHDCDVGGIVRAYGDHGEFLRSSLASCSPADVLSFFHSEGVATKVEEGGKIFPTSDRATDVVAALLRAASRSGVTIQTQSPVISVEMAAHELAEVVSEPHPRFTIKTEIETYSCESVIVTTGGLSYPGSGTTGDGYAWAEKLGHTIVPTKPALTPITTPAAWVKSLSGLTLPKVLVRVAPADSADASLTQTLRRFRKDAKKPWIAEAIGGFLFTHFGLSGPAILDVSRAVAMATRPHSLCLECDFVPDRTEQDLDAWVRDQVSREGKRSVVAMMAEIVPRRLAEALLVNLQIPLEQKLAEISRDRRSQVVQSLKRTKIPIEGVMGFRKAEVTTGGIELREVDSKTMQSKLCRGLFLAGEILDLDGPIGGYNFQAAFSTGWLAGLHS